MKLNFIIVLFHLLPMMLCTGLYSSSCTQEQTVILVTDERQLETTNQQSTTTTTTPPPPKTVHCDRFGEVLSNVSDNTCFVIKNCKNNQIPVNGSVAIHNRKHLTIASNEMVTIVSRDDEACGIAFFSSQSVQLYNITIRNSSGDRQYFKQFRSNNTDTDTGEDDSDNMVIVTVLYFKNTIDINLSHVTIENHRGLAVTLIDCYDVSIDHLNVTYTASETYNRSGVFVYYTGLTYRSSSNNVLVIKDATFQNLNSERSTADILRNPAHSRSAFSVVFGNATQNNEVQITGSHFNKNKAVIGAAVLVTFAEKSHGNTVTITGNNKFLSNSAEKFGGAVFVVSKSKINNNNNGDVGGLVKLNNSTFRNNAAEFGGALFVWRAVQVSSHINIEFSGCVFSDNTASLGSDVVAVRSSLLFVGDETDFKGNKLCHNKWLPFGSLSLFNSVMIVRETTVKCQCNVKSGMVLTNSILQLDKGARMLVANNSGVNGGGINMCSRSFLIFNAGAHIQFENNTAERKGGALYVLTSYVGFESIRDNYIYKSKSTCFVQTPERASNSTIFATFKDNDATDGHSIYATSLKRCTKDPSRVPTEWHFNLTNSRPSEIATDPVSMFARNSSMWTIVPGKMFHPTITAKDEGGRNVSFELTVLTSNEAIQIHRKRFIVTNSRIALKINGNPTNDGITFNISLVASSEVSTLVQNLTLSNCLHFYTFNKQNKSCVCEPISKANFKPYVSQCFHDGVYIHLDYWVEKSNINATHICPRNYCKKFDKYKTRNDGDILYEPDLQCRQGRDQTSRLCSKCNERLSVAFNVNECIKCEGTWPKRFARVILVSFAYDVIVTFGIILLNRNVLAGFINPVIYSYKLMGYFLKDLGDREREVSAHVAYLFEVISCFDLQGLLVFTDPYCFVDGMNNLNKLWVYFGSAMMWIVAFAAIYNVFNCKTIIKHCKLIKRISEFLPRDAYYRSLNSIVFMIYITLLEFAFDVLHYEYIGGQLYVHNYADEMYFHGEHIGLVLVAAICLLLNVLYIVLLVVNITAFKPNYFHTKLQRYTSATMYAVAIALKRGFKVSKKQEDSEDRRSTNREGCTDRTWFAFGEDRTWFAPVYLILFTLYFALSEFFGRHYTFFVLFGLCLLMLFVYWRPYEKSRNNLVEAILLCNLVIVGILIDGISGMFSKNKYFLIILCICMYFPAVCLAIYSVRTIIRFVYKSGTFNLACNCRPEIATNSDEVTAPPLALNL